MTLLEFEHVSKHYTLGARQRTALRDITLELHSGELIGVWGLHNSGRSTLLRIAAGIEEPDEGEVRLDGQDLAKQRRALGERIGYCHPALTGPPSLHHGASAAPALSALMTAQLARGIPAATAKDRALAALRRTDVEHCAHLHPGELDSAESVRVSIAQALTSKPALLLIDEPTKGVGLLERDPILKLLRSLADEGIAILMSASESTGLMGADRALSLDEGKLRGAASPTLAPVIALPQRVSA